MNHISKVAIAIVAVALLIVIGMIALNYAGKDAAVDAQNTPEPMVQAENTAEPTTQPIEEPTTAPDEQAQDDAQAEADMYEGALAGLTEEEIGKLAMQEEQHSGETDEETADEDGMTNETVAGVAD